MTSPSLSSSKTIPLAGMLRNWIRQIQIAQFNCVRRDTNSNPIMIIISSSSSSKNYLVIDIISRLVVFKNYFLSFFAQRCEWDHTQLASCLYVTADVICSKSVIDFFKNIWEMVRCVDGASSPRRPVKRCIKEFEIGKNINMHKYIWNTSDNTRGCLTCGPISYRDYYFYYLELLYY
jgi:hypothetical protein